MKPKLLKEGGQALIILALAAIGLFGIAALAIDGSAKFSDRRHAQNAADTAAMTAARELARGNTANWDSIARNIADENGYDGNLVTNTVWVYQCSNIPVSSPVDCGPYNGYSNYVQAVITSRVNTFFAKVIGINQTQNTVHTVSYWSEGGPLYPGMAFVQYKTSGTGCPGEFRVGGSGTVTVDGGGLFINSNNPGSNNCGAFTQSGCQTFLEVINGGAITAVGDIALQSSCSGQVIAPSMTEGATPMPFPPDPLPPPSECAAGTLGYVQNNYPTNGTSTIWPGKYDTLPPAQATEKIIVMKPGNYCIFEAVQVTGSNTEIYGSDVFIYIRYNSQKVTPLSFQGGTVEIDAPNTGDYEGYLIYVDPGQIVGGGYAGSSKNCKINGGADDTFTGTILAPHCDFEINGGGNPNGFHAQLIAYTVHLNGNNSIYFLYDESFTAINQTKVGLMR